MRNQLTLRQVCHRHHGNLDAVELDVHPARHGADLDEELVAEGL